MTWADGAPAGTVDADIYFDEPDAPEFISDSLVDVFRAGVAAGAWAGNCPRRKFAITVATGGNELSVYEFCGRRDIPVRTMRRLVAQAREVIGCHPHKHPQRK